MEDESFMSEVGCVTLFVETRGDQVDQRSEVFFAHEGADTHLHGFVFELRRGQGRHQGHLYGGTQLLHFPAEAEAIHAGHLLVGVHEGNPLFEALFSFDEILHLVEEFSTALENLVLGETHFLEEVLDHVSDR